MQGWPQDGQEVHRVTKIATSTLSAPAGATTLALPKRKLAAGDYRAVVTPTDAAGNRGAAKTIAFKVLKK